MWKQWATRRPKLRRARNCPRARSATCSPTSRRCRMRRSATPSSTTRTPPPNRCPASKKSSRWCSPVCTRWNRTSTACCAMRSKSCGSTIAPSVSNRRTRWRWASASAADFWGCCTWKSCRNAWSASSTSISSPPRQACDTASSPPPAKSCRSTIRRASPTPRRSSRSRSRSSTRWSSRRKNFWAAFSNCWKTSAVSRRNSNTSAADA